MSSETYFEVFSGIVISPLRFCLVQYQQVSVTMVIIRYTIKFKHEIIETGEIQDIRGVLRKKTKIFHNQKYRRGNALLLQFYKAISVLSKM